MLTQAVFGATHAMMVSTNIWQKATSPTVRGIVAIAESRLLVTLGVAYVMITILALTVVVVGYIAVYVVPFQSSLYEEPKGLLGMAILLYKSHLMKKAKELRNDSTTNDGKVLERLTDNPMILDG